MIGFTKSHSNRKAHNWLIYDGYERFMLANTNLFTGALYDLGSGESPYKEFFLLHADTYVAVDWAGSFHDTKADVVANLNEPLPIDSEVANSIVSLSVLEHLREPQLMLSEAFRILKKDGAIVLQVPWQWPIHEAPHDYFRYTPYGLAFLFERAGFVDVKVEAQAGFFTTMAMKFNYFSRRFVMGPRFARMLLAAGLSVFWYVGQKLAPLLDKLDRNWELEACSYFVTARKP